MTRKIHLGDEPIDESELPENDELNMADFLRNVGNYLWKLSPAVSGMDQCHIERLRQVANAVDEFVPPGVRDRWEF